MSYDVWVVIFKVELMNYFTSLKTSERISLSFALFGFFSLLLFLILINVTYFFIWYADQKNQTFVDMERDYAHTSFEIAWETVTKDFKEFLLTHDTIIIPDQWELICSPGVERKIKEAPELIQDRYFYKNEDTLFFIYSKEFPEIGEVKVLFDTTEYVKSQVIIIKTGLIFIFLVFILQFFGGRIISKQLLKNLISISRSVKKVNINEPSKQRILLQNVPKDDEIGILAEGLNSSYDKIDEQTSKLKQFITDVSHEFKTPLMWMSSRLDVLEKKSEKNALWDTDVTKFFSDTRQNIWKLNGLLESLFFLSRIEEQQWCLLTSSIPVEDIFKKRLIKIAESFPHKELTYTLDISSDLYYAVEENTFCILIDNLISNAMKFSPEQMKIRVEADEWGFTITDNGPGIDTKDIAKIWEKFYRKDTNKEWFGVGLYLVKRIMSIYNWKILVESELWKWTKFKVDISKTQ